MTPDPIDAFLDGAFTRLLAQIPRPEPLAPTDPVDADETNHGVCAQGENE